MLTHLQQGKNSGIKAVLGGAQKKPLMTKISTRSLNEIVRERNQYSRDAMDAWQDFINLKGRMDTELTKVTKRNNFLVDELESWKQQFLKFQAFAEQLTKETNELKVKIEGHKRENRRLTSLIDQLKDDAARLTVRLQGTEKQRDDALEALVLQQDIAEELERERKRNKKDLSAMQQANTTLLRQRDEAQRVVLHLRALIDGQAHHMEHIVKSLGDMPEIAQFVDAEEEASSSSPKDPDTDESELDSGRKVSGMGSSPSSRSSTRLSSRMDGERASSAMASRYTSSAAARKRYSELSMTDVADRHLRDKTDAIAYIIRNISEQCQAAVDGLDLARRADSVNSERADDEKSESSNKRRSKRVSKKLSPSSEDGESQDQHSVVSESDFGDGQSDTTGYLRPLRTSQPPPTPELVHDRSSTSMSLISDSTAATPSRNSVQNLYSKNHESGAPSLPTRILEHEGSEYGQDDVQEPVTKFSPRAGLENRRSQIFRTSRIS